MSLDATLPEVLDAAIAASLEGVHTVIPGRIKSYSGHKERLAVVQPSVRLPMPSGPMLDIPEIQGVPVVFPSTKAGSLLFPVKPGDGVLILFSEVGIGRYMGAAENDVVDADSMRRHSLADAIAIPGMFNPRTAPALPDGADEDKTLLLSDDGAFVELGDRLKLQNGASNMLAELQKLWDALIALRTELATQFGNIGTGVGFDATFLGNTVAALTDSSNAQTAALPGLTASRLALLEFFK